MLFCFIFDLKYSSKYLPNERALKLLCRGFNILPIANIIVVCRVEVFRTYLFLNTNVCITNRFSFQLENSDINASMETYELAASALEEWEAGTEPFIHVIRLTKRHFPSYRLFKEAASVTSRLSVSSCNAQNAGPLSSPLLSKDAVVPSGSETRLVTMFFNGYTFLWLSRKYIIFHFTGNLVRG